MGFLVFFPPLFTGLQKDNAEVRDANITHGVARPNEAQPARSDEATLL